MRLERREHRPLLLVVLSPILAVAAALALAGILIALEIGRASCRERVL